MANLDIFDREGLNDRVKENAPAFRATLEKLLDLPSSATSAAPDTSTASSWSRTRRPARRSTTTSPSGCCAATCPRRCSTPASTAAPTTAATRSSSSRRRSPWARPSSTTSRAGCVGAQGRREAPLSARDRPPLVRGGHQAPYAAFAHRHPGCRRGRPPTSTSSAAGSPACGPRTTCCGPTRRSTSWCSRPSTSASVPAAATAAGSRRCGRSALTPSRAPRPRCGTRRCSPSCATPSTRSAGQRNPRHRLRIPQGRQHRPGPLRRPGGTRPGRGRARRRAGAPARPGSSPAEARERLAAPTCTGPPSPRTAPGSTRGASSTVSQRRSRRLGAQSVEGARVAAVEPGGSPSPTADRSPPRTSSAPPRRGRPPCRGTAAPSRPSTRSWWRPSRWTTTAGPASASPTARSFADHRHVIIYGQRTVDDRLAFGGRGAPYHFGSRVRPEFDHEPTVFADLRATLTDLLPAARGVEFTHAWGGPLGIARDWHPSVGHDPSTGLGWAGGYVGDGVAASNLAGRTLADLVTGRHTASPHCPGSGTAAGGGSPNPLAGSASTPACGWPPRRPRGGAHRSPGSAGPAAPAVDRTLGSRSRGCAPRPAIRTGRSAGRSASPRGPVPWRAAAAEGSTRGQCPRPEGEHEGRPSARRGAVGRRSPSMSVAGRPGRGCCARGLRGQRGPGRGPRRVAGRGERGDCAEHDLAGGGRRLGQSGGRMTSRCGSRTRRGRPA